ncbi:hypothetical protein, partial [Aeromonas caviae]|uniref:hypothetical protein n=1 Tax=Aeromonas caviae TaxID=648 RepID=UPI001C5E9015
SLYGHEPPRDQDPAVRQDVEMLLFTTNRQSAEPADYRVIDWTDRKRQERRLLAPLLEEGSVT